MPEEKYVEDVFNSIHRKYDLVDSFISLGMDRNWRRTLISMIADIDPEVILDCGAGTGKLSLALRKQFPQAKITAFDLSGSMLSEIRDSSIEKVQGSALELPFEDSSVDLVTAAFLTRNLPDRKKFFSEVRRVLKPGGVFVNLDIHFPENKAFATIFRRYFFKIVPFFGDAVTGSDSYSYLVRSVKAFPSVSQFEKEVTEAGFTISERKTKALDSILILRLVRSTQE